MKFKKLSDSAEKKLLISMLVILGASSISIMLRPRFLELSGLRRADLVLTASMSLAGLSYVAVKEYKKSKSKK